MGEEAGGVDHDARRRRDEGEVGADAEQRPQQGRGRRLRRGDPGHLPGRGPDQAQGREALGALGGAQVGDDGDQEEHRDEGGDRADGGDDPPDLGGVVVADELGDDLRRRHARALPAQDLGLIRPDHRHQRVRALDGVIGQGADLLAVALPELVGGRGVDELGQRRRGQVLARPGHDVGAGDAHARVGRGGHQHDGDDPALVVVGGRGDRRRGRGQDRVRLQVGGVGRDGLIPGGAPAALAERLRGRRQHEEDGDPDHDPGDDAQQAASRRAIAGDHEAGEWQVLHRASSAIPVPALRRPSRTTTSRSA